MTRWRRSDKVSPELHDAVIARDIRQAGGCVAAYLDPSHACRNRWGEPQHPASDLTLDHVQSDYGRMGKRAPSDPGHLVSLCFGAHLGTGWATSHRALLRDYLGRAAA